MAAVYQCELVSETVGSGSILLLQRMRMRLCSYTSNKVIFMNESFIHCKKSSIPGMRMGATLEEM